MKKPNPHKLNGSRMHRLGPKKSRIIREPSDETSNGISFTLRNVQTPKLPFNQAKATILTSLGTQATDVAISVNAMAELIFGALPTPCALATIDSMDGRAKSTFDADGNGTDPEQGDVKFRKHASQLKTLLMNATDEIMQPSSQFPTATHPRHVCDFFIVHGCGGTGGSVQHLFDLCHEVGADHGIRNVRIHQFMIGPRIALTARNRHPTPNQRQCVTATAHRIVERTLKDMASPDSVTFTRIDGAEMSVPRSTRVWTITYTDASNGYAQFTSIDDFNDMLARIIFARIFSPAGAFLDARRIDHVVLGDTGQILE